MERKCVVPGCFSSDKDNFFMFPLNNRELLNNWMLNMSFLEFQELDLNECLVCEKHFEEQKIVREGGYIRGLIPDAVPTVFQLPKQGQQEVLLPPAPVIQMVPPPMVEQQQLQQQTVVDLPVSVPELATVHSITPMETVDNVDVPPQQDIQSESLDPEVEPLDDDESTYTCRFCLKTIDDLDESVLIDGILRKHFKNLTNSDLESDVDYSEVSCHKCASDIKKSSVVKSKVIANQRKLVEMVEQKHNGSMKIKQEFEDDFFYNEENLEVQIQENDAFKQEYAEDSDDFIPIRKSRKRHRHRDRSRRLRSYSREGETDHDRKKRLQRKYEHAKEKILCTDCGQYFSRGSIRFHHLRIHIKTPKFQVSFALDFYWHNFSLIQFQFNSAIFVPTSTFIEKRNAGTI
jgi:hypothetical protein